VLRVGLVSVGVRETHRVVVLIHVAAGELDVLRRRNRNIRLDVPTVT
jgi:hypothetical protein